MSITLRENDLLFAKVRKNAIIPTKENGNAGYDIYANFKEDYMIVPVLSTKMIPTGIASALHHSKYIQLEERGSTGSKGIKKSCGVIDSNFRGEWFIAITNSSKKDIIISKLNREELIEFHGIKDKYNDTYIASDGYMVVIDYEDIKEDEDSFIIYPYSKAIVQAVIHEVPKMEVKEITYEDLSQIESNRGIGILGSTTK